MTLIGQGLLRTFTWLTLYFYAFAFLIFHKSSRAGTLLETLVGGKGFARFCSTDIVAGWTTFYVLLWPFTHHLCEDIRFYDVNCNDTRIFTKK